MRTTSSFPDASRCEVTGAIASVYLIPSTVSCIMVIGPVKVEHRTDRESSKSPLQVKFHIALTIEGMP
ncbi:MAG: hypothetical protein IPF41_11695 [Flavobacteriales bacterium]|nr:hypothetical protein [Flavobacteriales bacterium]